MTTDTTPGETMEGPTPEGDSISPMDQLRAEVTDLRDKLLRSQAEVRNVTRRLTDEKQTALRYANTEIARALLPVVDNFERLLSGLSHVSDVDPFKQGARLTYELLAKALADHRIVAIEAVGKPFEPEQHEAIRRVESAGHADGTVVEVYEKGYRLADRVLRTAKVAIAAAPSGGDAATTSGAG